MSFAADNLVDLARLLIMTAAPLAGKQAVCQIDLKPTDGTARRFIPGSFFVPVINGGVRHELAFMAEAAGSGAGGAYSYPGGGPIQVRAMLGGNRFNAAVTPGTEMRLDPPVPGFEKFGRVTKVLQKGTDSDPKQGPILRGGNVGEPGVTLNTLELWRNYLGDLPGIFPVWTGSEPADGLATSTLARARSRAGEGVQLYSETFVVYITVARGDGNEERSNEGVRLVDAVSARLNDRQTLDGKIILSNPNGVQIRSRTKINSIPREVAQQIQIFGVTVALTRILTRVDDREYSSLYRFKTDMDLVQGEEEES